MNPVSPTDNNIRLRPIFLLALALMAVIGLAMGAVWLFQIYLSKPRPVPIAASEQATTSSQVPPGPHLQKNPHDDLIRFRLKEEQTLNTYSWIDNSHGQIQLPIERAMDLTLKKGLPSR